MKRRKFIEQTCLTYLGMSVSGALIQGCNPVYVKTLDIKDQSVVLSKAEFVITRKEKRITRQWVLINAGKLPFPIAVYRFDEDHYAASYLECTHQQCEVAPEGDYLQCPCHGSEFSNTGKLRKGPAEADLKTFEVATDQNNIYILLK